jgi:hypothetical protein
VGFKLKLLGEKHKTASTCSQLQTYYCGHQRLIVESVVSTPGLEGPELESWQAQGIYLFSKTPTPVLRLTHSPVKEEPGTLPPAAHRPEGGGESRMSGAISPVILWLHLVYRDKFTFYNVQRIESVILVVGFSVIIVSHVWNLITIYLYIYICLYKWLSDFVFVEHLALFLAQKIPKALLL